MVTKKVPTLDGSNHVFDKHIPAGIARAINVIATALIDANNGVASIGTDLRISVARETSQGVISVTWDPVAGWPASRPTARTDISVWAYAPSSIGAQTQWKTLRPSWMIEDDRFEIWDPS